MEIGPGTPKKNSVAARKIFGVIGLPTVLTIPREVKYASFFYYSGTMRGRAEMI